MKFWEEKELKQCIEDYLNFVDKETMEQKYLRNFHNIQVKMHSLGINRGYNYKINALAVVERYLNNESLQSIADDYNVDYSVIKGFLKRNNIKIRRITKKYYFDEDYFSKIDSEDKAYFLGFLFADGCNTETESKVTITLQKRDGYILEKFKEFLKLEKPPKDKLGYSHLLINSPTLSRDLANLGCIQRKSKAKKFPNIDKDFYHHFIRGYFDGNGSIYVNGSKYSFSIASSREFLIGTQDILIQQLQLKHLELKKHESDGIAVLIYSGRRICEKIYDYLYKDASIFLHRKQEKFCLTKIVPPKWTVLSKEQSSEIRNLYITGNYTIRQLQKLYGTSNMPINNILNYVTFSSFDLELKCGIKAIMRKRFNRFKNED